MTESSPLPPAPVTESADLLAAAQSRLKLLGSELRKVIVGQDATLDAMVIALLCGGHALLEGVPGTAKTLAVRTLARTISCEAKRIQFTPDLMPSDMVGTNVFNLATNTFDLRRGPIFTDLLLADEINRAPAKTQSALLEGMSERHATIDGVRHELSPIFTVYATQNPIEFEGTYPLPEAQQDRFLLKIKVDYPDHEAERAILAAFDRGEPPDQLDHSGIVEAMTVADVLECRRALALVRVEPALLEYVLKIIRATRKHDSVLVGAGPRGSIFLLLAAKARALMLGRDFLIPDDVVAMMQPVLAHRITLHAEAEISGATPAEVLNGILESIDVPR